MRRFDMSTILSVCVLIILTVAGCAEVQQPSSDADSYYNRGLAYHKKGQYDQAISDCTKAIEINARHADAYITRGAAYNNKGEYDQAISDFNKAIEINPRLARAYYNRGAAYHNKGEYDQAISDFNKAIEINPRLARAYYNRGLAYRTKGQHDQAISDYTKAIELDPRFARAYGNRGLVYADKGQYDKAISDYTKAIKINPRDAIAYNNRGNAYQRKGQYDQAISDYTKAIKINPRDAIAYYNRGLAYGTKGQYDQAIADYTKVLEINPRYYKAYYGKATECDKAGRIKKALEAYRGFLNYAPSEEVGQINYAKQRITELERKAAQKTEAVAARPSVEGAQAGSFHATWAVLIGVSEYRHAGEHGLTYLPFADDDARAFAATLRKLGWRDGHMRLLLNQQATKRNITIALESWLTKAGPDDLVVVFWSGHGFPDPEDAEKVYFACYDTEISIPPTGYRMDKVRSALEERGARNVVMLADTCHAGKLITRGDKGIAIVPQIQKMRREQTVPKGWIFMVGADADRQAIEHTSWTNGAFTHCLLDGLSGKADGYLSAGPRDGLVTMGEIRAYLNTVMPEETQKVLGVAKRPLITTSSGDPDIWNLSLQAR